ncbi:Uncharacterized protein family UPF0114, partial [Cynara cardunculus var. scolymus]
MKPARLLTTNPSRPILFKPPTLGSNVNWVYGRFRPPGVRFPLACLATSSTHDTHLTASPTKIAEVGSSGVFPDSPYQGKSQRWEENVEKGIYNCRFLTLLAVLGSLIGSFLYVYLLGTVMLVFGMGLYELFISNLDLAQSTSEKTTTHQSNLFGLFVLKRMILSCSTDNDSLLRETFQERPKWLEIKSVNALKTKLGHVIVMLLLIGLFEKSKKAAILTATDLVCFSGCVL